MIVKTIEDHPPGEGRGLDWKGKGDLDLLPVIAGTDDMGIEVREGKGSKGRIRGNLLFFQQAGSQKKKVDS
jgi:hypothetical protein